MRYDWQGRVTGVYVGQGEIVSEPGEVIHLSLKGILNDRHRGHTKLAGVRERKHHPPKEPIWNGRTVSIVSLEELAHVAELMKLSEIKPEWVGANIAVTGIPCLTQLPPFTRLVFDSGATVFVYKANKPCRYPAEAMQQEIPGATWDKVKCFVSSAEERRGLVGWVGYRGRIKPGDKVSILLPDRSSTYPEVETVIHIGNQVQLGIGLSIPGDHTHSFWCLLLRESKTLQDQAFALWAAIDYFDQRQKENADYERVIYKLTQMLTHVTEHLDAKRKRSKEQKLARVEITVGVPILHPDDPEESQ